MTRLRAMMAIALVVVPACDRGDDGPPSASATASRGPRPFPVDVQAVTARDISYAVSAVGSVEAHEQIQVSARVTGVVEKVRFNEGDRVKAGQPLVEIEPERFQLAVRTASAALARAEATLAEAQAGVKRREQATEGHPGLIPGEEIETWRTRESTARAEVASARAALDRTRLDLRDAYVRAPVAGVLETRTVNTGQFVQPGLVLATLIQRDPLLLRFEVPEREAARLSTGMAVSFVGVESEAPYTARISLVTTAADPSSRMVKVTAEIDDPRKASLRPGSFARVSAQLGDPVHAIVIPQTAVRPSEKGFLAFVVIDGKAVERVIETGMRTADGQVEVKRGLAAGESLVVRGAEALRTGAPVVVAGARPTGTAPAGGTPAP